MEPQRTHSTNEKQCPLCLWLKVLKLILLDHGFGSKNWELF